MRPLAHLLAVPVAVTAMSLAALPLVAQGHEDPGGPQQLDDQVKLSELTALAPVGESNNPDDGGGDSEYCIRATFTHPGHEEKAESVHCVEVNWDNDVPGVRPAVQFEHHDPDGDGFGELPLVGTGGAAGASWAGPSHLRECSPTEPWTLTVALSESDDVGIEDILKALGDALAAAGELAPPRLAPALNLPGRLAGIIGPVLDRLLGGTENLGTTDLNWRTGVGDPSGVDVPNDEGTLSSAHFRTGGTKTVVLRSSTCPTSTPTTTPTPTPTPTPTTSPRRVALIAPPECRRDERHLFCPDAELARPSWTAMLQATRAARDLTVEPGTGRTLAQLRGTRLAAYELIGRLMQDVAYQELYEARRLGSVPEAVLESSRAARQEGNRLIARAVRLDRASALRVAIQQYQDATNYLLPYTHP